MATDKQNAQPPSVLYSSGNFFVLAKAAYERSKISSGEAIVAIILSATALEVFINEIPEVSKIGQGQPEEIEALVSILDDLEQQRIQIKLKVQFIYYILTKKRLDIGTLPYQDFDLLVDIRNALLHKKPEKIDWRPDDETREYTPHRFVQRLAQRGVIPRPPAHQPPQWQALITSPEVARWSYNVAVQMARFLTEPFPSMSAAKHILSFLIRDLPEIP